jgi:tRNA nucleotidyltransferase (CCA-adding enzyme)
MTYPEYISAVLSVLRNGGYEAYVVGGSVRDSLIGLAPNDFDITTSALPEQTIRLFSDFKLVTTGLKHGTVTIISDGHPVEVTTFRIDGDYKDSRHPSEVLFTDSIVADLSRRDFTVNAMAYDDERGVIDPFDGQADLKAGIIRTVGEAERRFSEDALRIMRAFRFSAQLGFSIDDATITAARSMKEGLSNVSRERIAVEFLKLITSDDPTYALSEMKECGVFEYVLGDHLPSDTEINALACAPKNERTRLAILLCSAPEETRRSILSGLKLSNKLTSNTLTIARRLCEAHPCDATSARRFIGACGELIEDTLGAARALGTLDAGFEALVRENLSKKLCFSYKDLAIGGKEIMALGADGREIGAVLDLMLEHLIREPNDNTREALTALAKEYLESKGNV